MTSLEIINKALYRLGSQPASSLSDTAKAAARAVEDYASARDQVLRLIAWPTVVSRVALYDMAEQATPWTLSRRYGVGERVTNDTGKTYQCITAGRAAASGGPTGTGGSITDGTVVWEYKEASSATNNWCHAGSTAYYVNDLVSWDAGKVFACITAGTTAAATPPTSGSSGYPSDITDGTVHWKYLGTPPANMTVYGYQYIVPPDCLRILKIPDDTAQLESEQGYQYKREGICIYTDLVDAWCYYVRQETDPTIWDALLQEVVVLKLASDIAFDVTGNEAKAKSLYDKFAGMYATARPIALNEGAEGTPDVDRWEDA